MLAGTISNSGLPDSPPINLLPGVLTIRKFITTHPSTSSFLLLAVSQVRLLLIKFSADIILLVFPSGSSCYASLIAAEGPKFEENNKLRGEKLKTGVTLGYWRGRKTLTDRTCTRHTSTSSLLFVVAVFKPLLGVSATRSSAVLQRRAGN